jgi:hypothetical protein
MAQRTGRARPQREVRVMFEPTRLADDYLADAYTHLVPLVRRPVGATPPDADRSARPATSTRWEVQP